MILSLIVVVGVCAHGAQAAPTGGKSFGDRLFEASLPQAERSLHGRFISEMVAGTLPLEAFKNFLAQDNLYLSKYARAFAVLAAKAERTDELEWLLGKSVDYLHEHGPDANTALDDSLYDREAMPVTKKYASFFQQAVWDNDQIIGYASVLPCQRLYDWMFSTIKETMHVADDNPYKAFIDHYADPANHQTTKNLEKYLERYVAKGVSEKTVQEAQDRYSTAMNYEVDFFDQALSRTQAHGPLLAAESEALKQEMAFALSSSRERSIQPVSTPPVFLFPLAVSVAFITLSFAGMYVWSRYAFTVQFDDETGKLPLLSA